MWPLWLLFSVAACALLCLSGWKWDNKYTAPRHPAAEGVTTLDADSYNASSFLYLLDGWEFYQGRLLGPEDFAGAVAPAPDKYFYIGRYGGFDMGDPAADPHGQGTWRMVVKTGQAARTEYALELVQHYSRWRLWVNGELRQSVGMGGDLPAAGMVTFFARDTIEIIVAVADDTGLYSGFVYPPAFGSPALVGRVNTLRLLAHCAVMAAALLLGVLFLAVGVRLRAAGQAGIELVLLCLCFCVAVSWPLTGALGWYAAALAIAERFCTYAIYLLLVLAVGRLCGLPKKMWAVVAAAGALVCLTVLVQPLVPVRQAGMLYAFASALAAWKWLAALFLLGSAAYRFHKGATGSRALLCGAAVFATALVCDRLLPLYEPILFGWPVEWASFVLILIIAGLLWRATVDTYQTNLQLVAQKQLTDAQLAAQTRYTALQQEHLRRTERILHESRNRLVVIRHRAAQNELEKLLEYVDEQLRAMALATVTYTGNPLLDAILNLQFERVRRLGVYAEHEFAGIPAALPLPDEDLTAILMNLLDNALDACEALPDEAERWLHLRVDYDAESGRLEIAVRNAARLEAAHKGPGHGHGLEVVRQAAECHRGQLSVQTPPDGFVAMVTMWLTSRW